nr:hypothetical protein [uncultured Sphaerochaeta sp.]
MPNKQDASNFYIMERIKGKKIGPKIVICGSDAVGILGKNTFSLPVSYL